MRAAALPALLLLATGCYTVRDRSQPPPPPVGVLVQGATGRCAPVLVGSVVRRVCLPPGRGEAERDTATTDSVARGR